ncbi:hypothetical protein [Mucilaginibacter sp. SJ]|uniref:hypothetical protein n=1 Tax=Mucilaginibacter sp. SJ TaxID=3029053 RepID=UPI0023A933E5|nr:hypothetical protein [Mucilaginibacter sp. SJ]WEA01726.1 hypothetical protein MusilaSJ_02170 [Mucilaginibacter sp. SJ]
MKRTVLLIALLWVYDLCYAQMVVFDPQHFAAVVQNTAVRSGAETTHQRYLNKINDNIEDVNLNAGVVVTAQTIIYNGLSNVNSALKNGIAVRNISVIVSDILSYSNQLISLSKDEPYLLVFAGQMTSEMRQRAMALLNDVSGFALKEGNNMLADYNARDALLRRITEHLQIIDGLAYGAWKAVFWAKQRGIVASLNPFAEYISQDRALIDRIIQNAKYLKD